MDPRHLLDRAWPYVAYTRPRSIPVTMVMAMTGWLASPGHERQRLGADLLWLGLVHSVLLWGGTNAFNSAEDQDRGPVNLLVDPPPMPPHLRAFGLTLLVLAIPAAATRGPTTALLALAAVLLSIFYSWRHAAWRRGKEIPGIDNLINAAGFGFGSFGLGWCATGAPISTDALALGLGWTVVLFGGMPTAQVFQLSPADTAATARNWTAWLGASRTLRLGAALFLVHLGLVGLLSRPWGLFTGLWAVGVVLAAIHSAHWSGDPWTEPYRRMLRQMTLLTTAQLIWAMGRW